MWAAQAEALLVLALLFMLMVVAPEVLHAGQRVVQEAISVSVQAAHVLLADAVTAVAAATATQVVEFVLTVEMLAAAALLEVQLAVAAPALGQAPVDKTYITVKDLMVKIALKLI